MNHKLIILQTLDQFHQFESSNILLSQMTKNFTNHFDSKHQTIMQTFSLLPICVNPIKHAYMLIYECIFQKASDFFSLHFNLEIGRRFCVVVV